VSPRTPPTGQNLTSEAALAWDLEWAAERAAEAMRYLAANCPASSGAPELHPWQDVKRRARRRAA
jgi:hypothetical protein